MATNFAVFKLSFNPQNVAGYVPPYIFAEIRSTKADKDLFSFKVFELWIFENTQKWKRHHDAAWTIYPPLSFTVIRILAVSACALTLDVSVTGIFWKTSRHQILSSVTLSWHGHAPSFFPHPLFAMPCVFRAAGSHASSAWPSPSPGGSFLMGCVGGQISFIHRCVGCYLSNPIWCDLCRVSGPTFHNKFFLNSLVFRLVSHFQGGLWLITWRIASLWLAG